MAIRSVEDYKAGLNDGRTLFFKGDRVEDVTRHPDLGVWGGARLARILRSLKILRIRI